jgi:hypothetical protein
MNPEYIKPIPKYIIKKIQRLDKLRCPEQKGTVRFYSYLTKIRGELVKITVAVKTFRKEWHCKQVAIHGVKSTQCFVKDMEYIHMGTMGFRVGWYAEGLYKYPKWYENHGWCYAECKYFNPYSITVNTEYISKFTQYKYSAYEHYRGDCIISYLKLYTKYPQTEYLLKLGLHSLHDSVMVLKLIGKDRHFCNWLISHKDEIVNNNYYVVAIITAYTTNKPIKQIQVVAEAKKKMKSDSSLQPIRELFHRDMERFLSYIEKQQISANTYLDYLNACNYLNLDMGIPKNRYPHDFNRWHDIRIQQYHTAQAMADEKQRAELYNQFAMVAEKYLSLQKQGLYAVFIAKSPAELIREGRELNHCVGQMNYDQKMARGETLIFFIRSVSQPDTPFVTVEYSPKSKKVLQCYGNKNTTPNETVLDFVNKVWLPHANRTICALTRPTRGEKSPCIKKLNTQIA